MVLTDSQVDGALRALARTRRALGILEAARAVAREVALSDPSPAARRAADSYAGAIAFDVAGHAKRAPRSQSKLLSVEDRALVADAARRGAGRFLDLLGRSDRDDLDTGVMLGSDFVLAELGSEWAPALRPGRPRRLAAIAA